jgi:small conductance mechanosensitive channel
VAPRRSGFSLKKEPHMESFIASIVPQVVEFGTKVLGALVLWFVGNWVIRLIRATVGKGLERVDLDVTLKRWVGSLISIGLTIFLAIAILGVFGVETTSFAALIAAAGLAIGAAWSGLLGNFASGVMLLIFKPIKVGDFVTAGGVTGTVVEIGMFATVINTLANVRTIVGNGAISGGVIENFSVNAFRAVDLRGQLAASVDPKDAIARLTPVIAAIPNVLADPAPTIEILEFTEAGPKLVVRPFCHNDHYWQVLFDTNEAIANTFGAAGYPQPAAARAIKNVT